MTATGTQHNTWGRDIIEVSKFGFKPIDQVGCNKRTLCSAAPIAVHRECGVNLRPFEKAELAEYMDAGPREGKAARLVRAQILERRGGVLPHNWTVVEHYKAHVDLKARMRDEGKLA